MYSGGCAAYLERTSTLSCARSLIPTRATRLLSLCEKSEQEISKLSNLGQYTALPESITIAGFCEY